MTRFMFAAVAGVLMASSASATPSVRLDGVRTAHISYRDLNLQSNEGRSSLLHRIRRASNDVCNDRTDLMPFVGSHGQCFRAAMASGVSQMEEIARR